MKPHRHSFFLFLGLLTLIFSFSASAAAFQGVTHNVTVGPGGQLIFTDATSNSNITTINVGDTVKWTFGSDGHTVTSVASSGPDSFSSSMNSGGVFSHTYNTAGTFPYFCIPHQSFGMTGQVIVNSPQVGHFSSTTVDLGSVVLGLTSPMVQLTFTNDTSSPLSMQSLAATGDFTQTNNCTDPLPANQSCTINLQFKPTTVGTRTGTLTHASVTTANLTGQGVDVAIVVTRLFRPHISGSVPTSSAQGVDMTFTNLAKGAAPLGISCEDLPLGLHCKFSPVQTIGDGVSSVHLDFEQPQRSRRLMDSFPASVKVRFKSGDQSFVVNVPTDQH